MIARAATSPPGFLQGSSPAYLVFPAWAPLDRGGASLLSLLCSLAVLALLASLLLPTVTRAYHKLEWQALWVGIYHESELNFYFNERDGWYDQDRAQFRGILKW